MGAQKKPPPAPIDLHAAVRERERLVRRIVFAIALAPPKLLPVARVVRKPRDAS